MSYDEFLRFIFPEGVFNYFELSVFKEKLDQVERSGFLSFGTVAIAVQVHYLNIVAFLKEGLQILQGILQY